MACCCFHCFLFHFDTFNNVPPQRACINSSFHKGRKLFTKAFSTLLIILKFNEPLESHTKKYKLANVVHSS